MAQISAERDGKSIGVGSGLCAMSGSFMSSRADQSEVMKDMKDLKIEEPTDAHRAYIANNYFSGFDDHQGSKSKPIEL